MDNKKSLMEVIYIIGICIECMGFFLNFEFDGTKGMIPFFVIMFGCLIACIGSSGMGTDAKKPDEEEMARRKKYRKYILASTGVSLILILLIVFCGRYIGFYGWIQIGAVLGISVINSFINAIIVGLMFRNNKKGKHIDCRV